MTLRTMLLAAAAFCAVVPGLAGAQVRVGASAGYSLLERQDTSESGTWYRGEVTLGRSWLVGGTIDVQFGDSDHLTFDGIYGPYHNDADRSCYRHYSDSMPCQLQDNIAGSGSLAIGVQYVRPLGGGRWRPYLGGGGGIKQSWYRYVGSDGELASGGSYSLSASFGVESPYRHPVRVEVRTVYLTDAMLLPDSGRWELQARATVFLTRFGGFRNCPVPRRRSDGRHRQPRGQRARTQSSP